jgi:hypothetical protein
VNNIESITKVLNRQQIEYFTERRCRLCQNYNNAINACYFCEGDINSTIINCIEDARYNPRIEIARIK